MNVTVMCDASYCPVYKVAGYGYWAVSRRAKSAGGGSIKAEAVHSSTVAEMMAVVNSVHCAIVAGVAEKGDSLLVQTDCIAAITAFEGQRANLVDQEQRAIRILSDICKGHGVTVIFRHVKAHTGAQDNRSVANHMCDKRARQGMKRARLLKQYETAV